MAIWIIFVDKAEFNLIFDFYIQSSDFPEGLNDSTTNVFHRYQKAAIALVSCTI